MLKIRPMQRHRPRRRPPEPCAISAATTKPLMRGCALAGARRGLKRKPREQKEMACGPFAGTLPGSEEPRENSFSRFSLPWPRKN